MSRDISKLAISKVQKMFLFYVLCFFKKGDTIQGGTLFKGGHYLGKYGIFKPLFQEQVIMACVQYMKFSTFLTIKRKKILSQTLFTEISYWKYQIFHSKLQDVTTKPGKTTK